MQGLRYREYLHGTGMLTGFPSAYPVKASLRTDLPPADDASPGNPGPFGGQDSHLTMLLLPPGSTIPLGPLDLTVQLLSKRNALLPDHIPKDVPRGLGSWLEPRIFSGPPASVGELLRFL